MPDLPDPEPPAARAFYDLGRRAGRERDWKVLAKVFGDDKATEILGYGPPKYGIDSDA